MCALPTVTGPVASCPKDTGPFYELAFGYFVGPTGGRESQDVTAYVTVTLHVTGCAMVTGFQTSRWAIGQDGFYRTLGDAMGINRPSQGDFVGLPTMIDRNR